jgi:sigma-E factor negative regulatory protein RseA
MNEDERSSQISALFDSELDATQGDLVSRRVLKDPGLKASWGRYATIGACIRGEPLSVPYAGRVDIATRVRQRLETEPSIAAPGAIAAAVLGSRASIYKGAWGATLAAGVAAAAILVMRSQVPVQGTLVAAAPVVSSQVPATTVVLPVQREVVRSATLARADSAAPSYTTPVDDRPAGQRMSAPLVNYVVAHSEYTTPVVRLSPLSTVMSGNFDPAENTVEMTEAEIGARR